MTPCTINGRETLRFAKTEQKAITLTAGLIHALSFHDASLKGFANELRLIASQLDENGVYRPADLVSPTTESKVQGAS